MSQVLLGEVIEAAKSDAILGIGDRAKIIAYIRRALELVSFKANFNPWLANLDVCSDECGIVTLPSFIGTVLQVNVGGYPTIFRNAWYQFHVNGLGSCVGPSAPFFRRSGVVASLSGSQGMVRRDGPV